MLTPQNKRTKVVCTVGPGTDAPGVLERMIASGMNVARFNFSHGTHAEHGERMAAVRRAATILQAPIALLLDTRGPEMRLGLFQDGQALLAEGSTFTLYSEERMGDARGATISHATLWKQLKPGQAILLNDGYVRLQVRDVRPGEIETVVENTGEMSDRKRVACPGVPILLPPLSAQDEADILYGIGQDVDYIAASFVQRAEDIVEIKRFLEEHQAAHIHVIAKVENEEGVRNLKPILQIADGLMVARGDLGVEIPAEQVPVLQKHMISLCNELGKPVITATQMLESMVHNPRPTRAETSDVANAILDGTDAVMLSAETATGQYPVAAVETMTRVALHTEVSRMYRSRNRRDLAAEAVTTEAISYSTVRISETLQAKAILTSSESGRTARMVSKYRPHCPIVMVSPHLRSLRRAALYWGVVPVLGTATQDTDTMVRSSIHAALRQRLIENGSLVVITAGVPSGIEGSTNMIRVHVVGEAAVRGTGIGDGSATGEAFFATGSPAEFRPGSILVVDSLTPEWAACAQEAAGLIAVEGGLTSAAAIAGLTLGIPTVIGVQDAFHDFAAREMITIDAVRGLIFRGEVNAR
ncbi:MAG: pyruvate kinase [Veillonellaceae bacterium]|nr:pyruvate kinase [Veillonellaceae bacterium]